MAVDYLSLEEAAAVSAGQVFRGKAEATKPNIHGVRLLQIKDIREGVYEESPLPWANIEGDKLPFIFTGGELVVPLRGERSDVMLVRGPLLEPTTAPNQVAIIRPNQQLIEPSFLFWYLNSNEGNKAIGSLRIGTTVGHISIKTLKTIRIPLLAIEDQKKIAKIYHNWLERRDALHRLLELGGELSHGLCHKILERG